MSAWGGEGYWLLHCWVVFRKELLDHSRDRRSLILALIFPLFGPVLLGVVMIFSYSSVRGQATQSMSIAMTGGEYAPGLVAFLESKGATVTELEGDPEQAVLRGAVPVALVVPPESAGREQFEVQLLTDLTRVGTTSAAVATRRLVNEYSRETAHRMLDRAALDYGVLDPVVVNQIDVGQSPNIALLFYKMIPPIVLFIIFMGSVYLAIDMTVGERERGTLEPLLSVPVARWQILLGKTFAAFAFSALGLVVNILAFRLILEYVVGRSPGLAAAPDNLTMLLIFLIAIPMMALAVTVQISIAAFTRSMKEAQIYLGLLPLLPAFPGIAVTMAPLDPDGWFGALPIVGQMSAFANLVAGVPINPGHVLMSALATLLLAALCFSWSSRLYQREKLFFVS